ncbi:MAG: winged helix-turn-helix domain-containing protein [Terriglobales bacterium]
MGPWVVRPSLNSVSRSGQSIRVEPKAMEVLVCLAEHGGKVVSKDKLIAEVWRDTPFVSDDVLVRCVSELRRAMEDDAKAPHVIETIPKRGYRLLEKVELATTVTAAPFHPLHGNHGPARPVAPVFTDPADQPANGESFPAMPIPSSGAKPAQHTTSRRKTLWLIAALVAIPVFLIAMNVRGMRDRIFASAKPSIHSIAVLPFDNLSGDPAQEYFAQGMTDELTTMLVKNSGLRVISRTSVMQYKNAHRPLAEIARELNVDGILEGSVARSANRVHMTAQLIYAPSDVHVWAESYDRDLSDLNSLQDELAQTIARQIGVTTLHPLKPGKAINPAAHDAYLLGRYYSSAEDLTDSKNLDSKKYYEKAIELEPDYAAAWSGLADYFTACALAAAPLSAPGLFAQAEIAAKKAVALDDSLAVAHGSMAGVYLFSHWDLARADRELLRAIELDPAFAEAHHERSRVLFALNRPDEAVQEQKKATEIDPFTRPWTLMLALMKAHQFDAAIEEGRSRVLGQPNDEYVHYFLSYAYLFKGMEKEAAEELGKSYELAGDKVYAAAIGQAFRHGGFKAVLERELSDSKSKSEKSYVSPLDFAEICAWLKRKDETIRYLQRAYEQHNPILVSYVLDPEFDFLHPDHRYQALVSKMGLSF